jgi:SulP family sulfate permease
MLGFVNGLAIVIFLAQLTQFQVPGTQRSRRAWHGRRAGSVERRSPDAGTGRA